MEKPRLAGVFFRLFESPDGGAIALEVRDISEKQISCSQHELVIRQAPRIGGRSSGVSAGP